MHKIGYHPEDWEGKLSPRGWGRAAFFSMKNMKLFTYSNKLKATTWTFLLCVFFLFFLEVLKLTPPLMFLFVTMEESLLSNIMLHLRQTSKNVLLQWSSTRRLIFYFTHTHYADCMSVVAQPKLIYHHYLQSSILLGIQSSISAHNFKHYQGAMSMCQLNYWKTKVNTFSVHVSKRTWSNTELVVYSV